MELAIIVAAIGIGSFIKGATGSGLPQIAIPVMATFLGVERAVVIMAIPGVLSNGWLIWANRDGMQTSRDLPSLLATGIVGGVLGTIGLKTLDPRLLSVILALIIIGYVAMSTLRPDFHFGPRLTRYASPPVGLVAGGLQGATGISGPLLTTYLHGFGLPPSGYVFSTSVLFSVLSVVQVVTLIGIGLYTQPRIIESLLAMIPIALFLPLGTRMTRNMSARTFKRVILILLVASAIKLIYDAIAG